MKIRRRETDRLIVGSGFAGIWAAIAAREAEKGNGPPVQLELGDAFTTRIEPAQRPDRRLRRTLLHR